MSVECNIIWKVIFNKDAQGGKTFTHILKQEKKDYNVMISNAQPPLSDNDC